MNRSVIRRQGGLVVGWSWPPIVSDSVFTNLHFSSARLTRALCVSRNAMFTYQTQARTFEVQSGEQFVFPNEVTLEFELFPQTAFGSETAPSRTMVRGRGATLTIDQDTGRWIGQTDPPLEPLQHSPIDDADSPQIWLSGNSVTYKFRCDSMEELQTVMPAFKWVLPTLLNLRFMEPPYAGPIRGVVGETAFMWRMRREELKINMHLRSKEELEGGFRDSLQTV